MAQKSLQPYYMIMLQQDSSATQLLVVHATGDGVLHSRSNVVVCVCLLVAQQTPSLQSNCLASSLDKYSHDRTSPVS